MRVRVNVKVRVGVGLGVRVRVSVRVVVTVTMTVRGLCQEAGPFELLQSYSHSLTRSKVLKSTLRYRLK